MQSSTQPSTPFSSIRLCALGLGLFFLLLGLAGFVPGFVAPPSFVPAAGFGYLFGIFPTNYFHNAIGILVGLWGLAASTSLTGSIVFNRIFAVIYTASAVLGLLPPTNTFFGTLPLFGNNVWFNAIVAAIAFYHGYIKPGDISMLNTPGTPSSGMQSPNPQSGA